jgi:hypothetical protein
MMIDLQSGDLVKARGYQQSPSGGLIPVYSICEVVAMSGDRVRVVYHYPNNPAGWELPSFTVAIEDIFPPF